MKPLAESMDYGRIWSLWDMLKESAAAFVELGEAIHDLRVLFYANENRDAATGELVFSEDDQNGICGVLRRLLSIATRLNMPVAKRVIGRKLGYVDNLPRSEREYNDLVDLIKDELSERLFMFVPSHAAPYYEWTGIVSDAVVTAFPKASEEIRLAGTAYAAGMNTAAVFHSMRAAEIGVKVLAMEMGITMAIPIEQAEWQPLLNRINVAVQAIENKPRVDPTRDPDLLFFSEAAAQFRFFKDGWRIRVMHARASYTESQAKEAVDHVRSFFETLAQRLKESP